MDKPKDHTVITVNGAAKIIYYEYYLSYDRLPKVARSKQTEQEYNEFWDWMISRLSEDD